MLFLWNLMLFILLICNIVKINLLKSQKWWDFLILNRVFLYFRIYLQCIGFWWAHTNDHIHSEECLNWLGARETQALRFMQAHAFIHRALLCTEYLCSPQFVGWNLLSIVTVFGGRTFGRQLGHEGGWDQCPYEQRPESSFAVWNVTRSQPSATWNFSPESNHYGTLISDFQPPKLWEIGFCCL